MTYLSWALLSVNIAIHRLPINQFSCYAGSLATPRNKYNIHTLSTYLLYIYIASPPQHIIHSVTDLQPAYLTFQKQTKFLLYCGPLQARIRLFKGHIFPGPGKDINFKYSKVTKTMFHQVFKRLTQDVQNLPVCSNFTYLDLKAFTQCYLYIYIYKISYLFQDFEYNIHVDVNIWIRVGLVPSMSKF